MISRYSRRAPLLAATLALLATACDGNKNGVTDVPPVRPARDRPTAEIIDVIRANEAKLNRALWSTNVQVVARFTDENGKEHPYNLEGSLLFQRPRNLLINLRPGIGENVMQVGSNENDYWAWIEPELERMWWGRHANAGKPCAEDILINPSELVAAMGIGLPSPDGDLIGPWRRHGKKSDLLYYGRPTTGGGQRLAQEYRVMRVPPYLVDVVVFYDEFGKQAMTAVLGEFREVWDGGPRIAHEISIDWPIDNNKLNIRIGSFKDFDESKIRPGAFARPIESPPLPSAVYTHMIQVDADCDRTPSSRRPIAPTGWNDDGTPHFGPVEFEEPSAESPDDVGSGAPNQGENPTQDWEDSSMPQPPEAP